MTAVYITDAVKSLNNNLANFVGGTLVTMRYADVIGLTPEPDDPDEVIARITSGLNKLGGDDGLI